MDKVTENPFFYELLVEILGKKAAKDFRRLRYTNHAITKAALQRLKRERAIAERNQHELNMYVLQDTSLW